MNEGYSNADKAVIVDLTATQVYQCLSQSRKGNKEEADEEE